MEDGASLDSGGELQVGPFCEESGPKSEGSSETTMSFF